jgi:MFS family permease
VIITINVCLNAMIANFQAGGIAPALVPISMEMGVTLPKAGGLLAYAILLQGLSNIVWVPTMVLIGKRYTVIATMVMFLPAIAWAASATSYNSLLGARLLAGFASGASESLAPAVIGDIWYEHDLSTALGVFTAFLFAGSSIGQVILGYVTEAGGWRWAIWTSFIVAAVNTATLIFFLPETDYQRNVGIEVTAGDIQRAALGQENSMAKSQIPPEHLEEVSELPTESTWTILWTNLWFIRHPHVNYHVNWFKILVQPLWFFFSPTAIWAAMCYSVAVATWTAEGVTVPIMFSPPPYLFNSGALGLFSLAPLVGAILGGTIGSKAVDVFNARVEQRRLRDGSSHKPEERLPMLFFPFLIFGPGMIMYGACIQKGLPWIAPAVGYALNSFGTGLLCSVCLSYVMDSYITRSGQLMVFVNIVRCLLSYGFADIAPFWLVESGPLVVFSTFAGITWAFILMAIPAFYFGERLRRITYRHMDR